MSRFAASIANGLDRIRQQAGVAVTYRRGGQSVAVTAVPSPGRFEEVGETDAHVAAERRDYLVKASNLVLGGSDTTPREGDEIVEAGVTYRVVQGSDDKQWQWSDGGKTTRRIHTVRVS
jgi:hypothetical protein